MSDMILIMLIYPVKYYPLSLLAVVPLWLLFIFIMTRVNYFLKGVFGLLASIIFGFEVVPHISFENSSVEIMQFPASIVFLGPSSAAPWSFFAGYLVIGVVFTILGWLAAKRIFSKKIKGKS